MSHLLPADCLNEIFENLEDDKITLRSCLLVNRLWCEVSVRILWRNIWSFKYIVAHQYRLKVASAILSTLIACLPNESKEFLHNNGIFISTPTLRSSLFNYASFCKVLSIHEIGRIVDEVLKNFPSNHLFSQKDRNFLVSREIIKMFMQISSLKKLTYYLCTYDVVLNIPKRISFTHFPGARDCLVDLSELRCSTNNHSEFFHHLSQICHDLQSLTIEFESDVSYELKELISLQNNLKNLNLLAYKGNYWTDIIPVLKKHSNTLTKLHLYGDSDSLPLSFVSLFSNLQEIKFSFIGEIYFGDPLDLEDFKELQYVTFPKLQILQIPYQCPKPEYVMKFLEINGKNLREFRTGENNHELNLSIAKFCPNLKKVFVIFNNDDLFTLKIIFDNCQYLESIEIWCGEGSLSEKEALEVVAKYSPKNFYELKIYNNSHSKLLPEDLESFFVNWKNRLSKKSLSLIVIKDSYNSLEVNEENMKIIEKYKNLGIIKKFEAKMFDEEEKGKNI